MELKNMHVDMWIFITEFSVVKFISNQNEVIMTFLRIFSFKKNEYFKKGTVST